MQAGHITSKQQARTCVQLRAPVRHRSKASQARHGLEQWLSQNCLRPPALHAPDGPYYTLVLSLWLPPMPLGQVLRPMEKHGASMFAFKIHIITHVSEHTRSASTLPVNSMYFASTRPAPASPTFCTIARRILCKRAISPTGKHRAVRQWPNHMERKRKEDPGCPMHWNGIVGHVDTLVVSGLLVAAQRLRQFCLFANRGPCLHYFHMWPHVATARWRSAHALFEVARHLLPGDLPSLRIVAWAPGRGASTARAAHS